MSTDNKQSLPAITLAAIGVVYGDIGTSHCIHFVNVCQVSLALALSVMLFLASCRSFFGY
ncbi:Kup system potassium uptake protein [Klebsiella michiganensis]|uniref:Kup system potassium uptake protein n=1 Tax=Klebsiella michiganensis TaxID=1134687 RepID=A0A7H4M373_9ENTR|nr:Kup system potassium uptake protein [Klebsiella michiganensis]